MLAPDKPYFNSHNHLIRVHNATELGTLLGQVVYKVSSGLSNPKTKNCRNCPGQDQELERNKGLSQGPARGKKVVRWGHPVSSIAMTEAGSMKHCYQLAPRLERPEFKTQLSYLLPAYLSRAGLCLCKIQKGDNATFSARWLGE